MIGFDFFDGILFRLFPTIFGIVFLLILGTFIATIVKSIYTRSKNNHSPRLSVDAAVVTKRTDVSHHTRAKETWEAGYSHSSSTRYYVTFQVESGDRMEFEVRGSEYGMLAEGDHGKLSFQGSRFLSFERG